MWRMPSVANVHTGNMKTHTHIHIHRHMQSLTIVVQISEHLMAPQGALIKGNVRRWPFAPDSYRHRTEAI